MWQYHGAKRANLDWKLFMTQQAAPLFGAEGQTAPKREGKPGAGQGKLTSQP